VVLATSRSPPGGASKHEFALGTVLWNTGEIAASLRAMKQAVDHAPSLARAHEQIAGALFESDRVEDAIGRFRTALAIDPSLSHLHVEIGRAYAMLGRWDRYDSETKSVSDDVPLVRRAWNPVRMHIWRGDGDALVLPNLDGVEAGARTVIRIAAAAERGRMLDAEAKSTLEEASLGVTHPRLRCARLQFASEVLGYTGDSAGAVTLAARAVDSGLHDLCWLRRCPPLAEARRDARWSTLEATVEERVAEVLEVLRGV
jgi:eukaryotic-like serine/threonine-protein kinase